MLLVGYHNIGAYKFYYPITNKAEFNRDVIVKESEAWDWSKSQSNSGVVPAFENISYFEWEFSSEGDSESEVNSESDSEGEFDSEGESGGDRDSGNITDSEGGHASKDGTSGVPAFYIIPASKEDSEHV